MKFRLRHPINSIREPFGKAGLIVACLALVFAMVGGAYAAGKLTSKQKKEVEKIAKKYAGRTGLAGSQGPAGPVGVKGDTGTDGKDGTNGTNGKEGPEGKQGKDGITGFIETLSSGKTETGSEGFGDGGLADIGGRSSVRRI
jgi:hypothetical protein